MSNSSNTTVVIYNDYKIVVTQEPNLMYTGEVIKPDGDTYFASYANTEIQAEWIDSVSAINDIIAHITRMN